MKVVRRADLFGEAIPRWLVDAVAGRHAGWTRANPTKAPGNGLVWKWALDCSGLPAAYRRAADVIADLNTGGRWTVKVVAERIGVDERTLRKAMVPRLVEWGWLAVEKSPSGSRRGWVWTATVPVAEPPDRVHGEPLSADQRSALRGPTVRATADQRSDKVGIGGEGREPTRHSNSRDESPPLDDAREFWSNVALIEAHPAMPVTPKRERHKLARLLAATMPGDPERVGLMLDHVAAHATADITPIDVVAIDLSLSDDDIHRLTASRKPRS